MPPSKDIDAALLREWPLPVPERGDKDERGCIFVVGGAPQMPGAVIMAATAALRAGAGKLRIGAGASIALHVGTAVPESYVVALEETDDGALTLANLDVLARNANGGDAIAIGPGLVDEGASADLIEALAARLEVPAVIDAAALACFADRAGAVAHLDGRAVLTPHTGEMAHMLGRSRDDVEADPAACAREAARRYGAVLVLKGATTFVAAPDGALYRNTSGDIGLATSGSGDTLAGIIGGLLARGLAPVHAACWGVHAHAQAGAALARRIGTGFLAREIPAEIPAILRMLDGA